MEKEQYDKMVSKIIDRYIIDGEDRDTAAIYVTMILQIIVGDYVAVGRHIVTNNPLPIADRRFSMLLRAVADLIEEWRFQHAETEQIVDEVMKEKKWT